MIHKIQNVKVTNGNTCDICGKTFASASAVKLIHHQRNEHPSDEQIKEVKCHCEKCSVEFSTSEELNTHLISCLDADKVKQFQCEKCNLITNWNSHIALQKHYAEIHRNIFDVCDICGLAFKSYNYIKTHKRIAHGGVPEFTCEVCGKGFNVQILFRKHMFTVHKRTEERDRLFKCKKCDYVTISNLKVELHDQSVHIRQVKYECDLCKYFGYRKANLKNHINEVHKKVKNIFCQHCQKGFYYKRDHIKHVCNRSIH
jgi:hypothetical protein